MSKRLQKGIDMKRVQVYSRTITRRQQVAALKQLKGDEIAAAVGKQIREAVKGEVETQLKTLSDTILNLIDRVVECEAKQNAVLIQRVHDERDSDDRSERTEGPPVLKIAEVVPDESCDGEGCCSEDGAEGPGSGGLLPEGGE